MRRVNKEKALEMLDQIEALTSTVGTNSGATNAELLAAVDVGPLELMVKVAKGKGGFELLVKKYAASSSREIAGALILILVQRAKTTKLKDARLLFEFLEKSQFKNDLEILVTILTALKYQIGLAGVWQDARLPESLSEFLRHCLEFEEARIKSGQPKLLNQVQFDAIDLLIQMCKTGIYSSNFDESQRELLEKKIQEISAANPENKMLQADASFFFGCPNK